MIEILSKVRFDGGQYVRGDGRARSGGVAGIGRQVPGAERARMLRMAVRLHAEEGVLKLLRYGPRGQERPALLASDGTLRDLQPLIGDVAGPALADSALARLQEVDHTLLAQVSPGARIGPCVGGVGKFIGIGLNYADHAREIGAAPPGEPVIFMKATSAISGAFDPIVVPRDSAKTDWEVELGVVIGATARHVEPDQALAFVAGYCVVNDVSERAWQLGGTGQWTKGKSADSFGPLGPWLVTRDEVTDPQNLALWLEVDGHRYQNGSTRTMIFDVPFLVSYLSRYMTLQPGDVICTGTPAGVGLAQRPAPVYLQPGQTVRLGVEGLGIQEQRVVAWDELPASG